MGLLGDSPAEDNVVLRMRQAFKSRRKADQVVAYRVAPSRLEGINLRRRRIERNGGELDLGLDGKVNNVPLHLAAL